MIGFGGHRHNELKVSTGIVGDNVEQVRDIFGEVTRHYVDVCAMQLDDAIRAKLIELGWTPPPTAGDPPA